MSRRTTTAKAVLCTLAMLMLAGCGLFDSSDDEATTTTTAPEPEADPEDLAAAEDAMLVAQDFPAGWQATEVPPEELEGILDIPGCETFKASVATVSQAGVAQPNSRSFTNEAGEEVTVVVTVYADEAAAVSYVDAYRSGDPNGCMAAIVARRDQRETGGVVEDQPPLGDESTGVLVTYSDVLPTEGASEFRWFLIRNGRAVALVYVARDPEGSLAPETYANLAAERLAA